MGPSCRINNQSKPMAFQLRFHSIDQIKNWSKPRLTSSDFVNILSCGPARCGIKNQTKPTAFQLRFHHLIK